MLVTALIVSIGFVASAKEKSPLNVSSTISNEAARYSGFFCKNVPDKKGRYLFHISDKTTPVSEENFGSNCLKNAGYQK